MKPSSPERRPVALTIAGSDSGGGAGVQADLKTMEATGAFATSAITAVTAQNTTGVTGSHVLPPAEIEGQCDAVFDDFDVRAIKTGMLATAEIIELVTRRVADADAPAVVDPVMIATSGDRLLAPAAEDAYAALIAESALVTPNADEAEVLTGTTIETTDDARAAGKALVEMGADAALVKGGHLHEEEETVVDVLVTDGSATTFEHPRIRTAATHGSGCTLSSAIAARLARGDDLRSAVEWGTTFMQSAVRYHHDVGDGPGAVHHLVALRNRSDRSTTSNRLADLVEEVRAAELPLDGPISLAATTAYAEGPDDVATAVVGRDTQSAPTHGPYSGDDPIVPRLLGVRDAEPSVRFAASVTLPHEPDAPGTLDIEPSERRTAYRRSVESTEEPSIVRERSEGDVVYTVFGTESDAVRSRLFELEKTE